jgi:mono/diheme cytochrome c family protein
MLARLAMTLALSLSPALAMAGPTSQPDPVSGKALAQRLCTNCHLVGTGDQKNANPDVPSFPEIANLPEQTAGAVAARIMLPKHPMPQIPLTKAELSDLAAYILSLRDTEQR